jgi:hypothetical protein
MLAHHGADERGKENGHQRSEAAKGSATTTEDELSSHDEDGEDDESESSDEDGEIEAEVELDDEDDDEDDDSDDDEDEDEDGDSEAPGWTAGSGGSEAEDSAAKGQTSPSTSAWRRGSRRVRRSPSRVRSVVSCACIR